MTTLDDAALDRAEKALREYGSPFGSSVADAITQLREQAVRAEAESDALRAENARRVEQIVRMENKMATDASLFVHQHLRADKAEAERDAKDAQLTSCYDRMNKAERQRDALRHDLERHVEIAAQQAGEIETLRRKSKP